MSKLATIFLVMLTVCLSTTPAAAASTFVGNGGSTMDGELLRIVKTLRTVVKEPGDLSEACTCDNWSNQCALLETLNDEQVKYCRRMVRTMQPQLLQLLQEQPGITLRWTSADLSLAGQSRRFDAIAQRERRTIVLNEDRFARMTPGDRLQLLAHEYLHFLSSDGKPLGDGPTTAPFPGPDGGRHLLDVVGAAFAVMAMEEHHVSPYESIWSRPYRKVYLGISGGHRRLGSDERRPMLVGKTAETSALTLTYYPQHSAQLGWSLRSQREAAHDHRVLRATMQRSYLTVGPELRYLPWRSGRPYADALFLSAHVGLGAGQVSHKFTDDVVSLSGRAAIYAAAIDLTLHIPLLVGLWLEGSYGARYTPYELPKLRIESRGVDTHSSLGVSYALPF